MKMTAIALATLAALSFAATAEAKLSHEEQAGWKQTVQNKTVGTPDATPVVEGRNAASTAVDTSEPYIRQSVEQNARTGVK